MYLAKLITIPYKNIKIHQAITELRSVKVGLLTGLNIGFIQKINDFCSRSVSFTPQSLISCSQKIKNVLFLTHFSLRSLNLFLIGWKIWQVELMCQHAMEPDFYFLLSKNIFLVFLAIFVQKTIEKHWKRTFPMLFIGFLCKILPKTQKKNIFTGENWNLAP